MENSWGDLDRYRGIQSTAKGDRSFLLIPPTNTPPPLTAKSCILLPLHWSLTHLRSAAAGELLVNGLQLGNVFIGVQPALGVEGDPMRLLFEKDLTPHPQCVFATPSAVS